MQNTPYTVEITGIQYPGSNTITKHASVTRVYTTEQGQVFSEFFMLHEEQVDDWLNSQEPENVIVTKIGF
jgi:hypothetical protein